MPDSEDISLLKRYADGDESAFTLLVERYIHLVYSTALRQVSNPSDAEEISQAVFIILARKAKSISPKTILCGWLYQAARLTAANFLRSENNRPPREQEAYMQSTLTEPDTASWNEIAPLLEEAMGRLGQADRDAIVLRFFENKTPQELAAIMGLNEVTARKRVSRALGRLRNYFSKRGVDSTTSAIAKTISGNAVQFAPVGLAKSVTTVALAKGAAASTSTLTLIKGALKIMAWTKAKTAIAVGVGILFLAGTGTVMVENRFFPSLQIYHGKLLSAWLKEYDNVRETFANHGAKLHELDKIVSQAGTNAIPTLLRLLREEDVKGHGGNGAANGFRVLGARATNAVPDLMKIYEQNPPARGDVLYSLNCIGTNADVPIDWLLPKLEDPDPKIRAGVAYVVGQMHTKSEQAIPALIRCLSDSSSHVRADAALALASCGADSESAIPQLIGLLNDKGKGVRNCAVFAIQEIDPGTAAKLGLR